MGSRVLLLALVVLLAVFSSSEPSKSGSGASKTAALKLLVDEDGVYRLRRGEIERAGLTLASRGLDGLRLFNQGKETPLITLGEGAEAEVDFYGEASRSKYTVTNVYWLTAEGSVPSLAMEYPQVDSNRGYQGPSPAAPRVRAPADSAAPPLSPRFSTLDPRPAALDATRTSWKVERNLLYQPNVTEGERWYWASVTAPSSLDLNVDAPDPAPTEADSTIRVALMGLTEAPANPDHHVQITLNGHLVSEGTWDGQKPYISEGRFPQSWLKETDNLLRVILPGDTNAPAEVALLDFVELGYQRRLVAHQDQLVFVGSGEGSPYTLQGFSDSRVRVFDVTDSEQVTLVAPISVERKGSSYSVSFVEDRPGRKYLAASRNALKDPRAILAAAPDRLRRPEAGADYVIVAPKSLMDSAAQLAQWREGQGLRVKVVDVEEIYDSFGHGLREPQAIKDFLKYTQDHWPPPKPAYVLLLGDTSYDYRGNLKEGAPNLIPTYLLSTPHLGETASDNWFVAFDEDSRPHMAIGRLPVKTRDEAGRVIGKIVANEKGLSGGGPREARALLISDETDPNFEATIEGLVRDYLPSSYQVTRAYLSPGEDASQVTARILGAFGEGLDLVAYAGHGSLEMLGARKILGTSDLVGLPAGKPLPAAIIMTCLAGYFQHPNQESIGEQLLLSDKKGAVAVLASSGLSLLADQDYLAKGIFRAMFQEGAPTLGSAILQAKQALPSSATGYYELVETFNLLGDPATPITMRR